MTHNYPIHDAIARKEKPKKLKYKPFSFMNLVTKFLKLAVGKFNP